MPGGVLEGDDLVFWQTFLRWSQGIHSAVNRAVSEAANLSVSEFEVLIRLWSDPDRTVSQHDLSTELGWSPSRASHLLRRLEARSYIARRESGDGRLKLVQLTEPGLAQLLLAFDAHGSAFRRSLLNRLTTVERSCLLEVMNDGVAMTDDGAVDPRQAAPGPDRTAHPGDGDA